MTRVSVLLVVVMVVALAAPVYAQDGGDLELITAENINRLTELRTLGEGELYSIAWSPDGSQIAVAGSHGLRFLNAETLEGESRWPEAEAVQGVWYSPDDTSLVYNSARYDVASGEQLLEYDVDINQLTFSPDGSQIAVTNTSKTDGVYDTATGDLITTFDAAQTVSFPPVFSPDGAYVAYAAEDESQVVVWDVAAGAALGTLSHGGNAVIPGVLDQPIPVIDAAFTPDGTTLITLSYAESSPALRGYTLRYWDMADLSGDPVQEHTGDQTFILLDTLPDSTVIGVELAEGTTRVWDIEAESIFSTLNERLFVEDDNLGDHVARFIAFSPDKSQLLESTNLGMLSLWDVTRPAAEKVGYVPPNVTSVYLQQMEFSRDGAYLANLSNNVVEIWDTATWSRVYAMGIREMGALSTALAFGPDSDILIVGTAKGTLLFVNLSQIDEPDYQPAESQQIHSNVVDSIVISPDGTLMTTSDSQGGFMPNSYVNTLLWDAHTGDFLGNFEPGRYGAQELKFSTDGRFLATRFNGGPVEIWRTTIKNETLAHIATLDDGGRSGIRGFTLDPDGMQVFTVSNVIGPDGNLDVSAGEFAVWDTRSGEKIAVLEENSVSTYSAPILTPDGAFVMVSGSPCTQVYDVETLELVTTDERCFVWHSTFSPDGTLLAYDMTIYGVPVE